MVGSGQLVTEVNLRQPLPPFPNGLPSVILIQVWATLVGSC